MKLAWSLVLAVTATVGWSTAFPVAWLDEPMGTYFESSIDILDIEYRLLSDWNFRVPRCGTVSLEPLVVMCVEINTASSKLEIKRARCIRHKEDPGLVACTVFELKDPYEYVDDDDRAFYEDYDDFNDYEYDIMSSEASVSVDDEK